MKENTKSALRRTVAAVLALAIVAGAPAQVFPGLFADTAISASAATTVIVDNWEQLQEQVQVAGSVIVKLNADMAPTRNKYFKVTGSDITIDLNGHSVIGNSGSTSMAIFQVEEGAKLTITDNSVGKRGVITGAAGMGAINVRTGGTLVLLDGTISGNKSIKDNYGGAVTLGAPNNTSAETKFIMSGGAIKDNTFAGNTSTTVGYGGGVICHDKSTFEMTGGIISGNVASTSIKNSNGGGVALRQMSKFIMSGDAVISGNKAKRGSAVGLSATTAEFIMNGGTIKENICEPLAAGSNDSNIGAISVELGTCTINGGDIIDNYTKSSTEIRGAGISYSGTLNISGKVNITGNYMLIGGSSEKKYSNIRINSSQVINIIGKLEKYSKIGVSVFGDQIITKGWSNMGSEEPKDYIVVDKLLADTYYPTIAANGEVRITKETENVQVHDRKFTVTENGADYSGSKVTVTTTVDGSALSSNVNATVKSGKNVYLDIKPKENVNLESVSYKYGNTETPIAKNSSGTYSFIMPDADVTVIIKTSDAVVEDPVTLKERSVSLKGDISLNYKLSVPASVKSPAMKFTGDFGNGEETVTVAGTDAGNGLTVFKCPVSAKNMTTKISAKLVSGNKVIWPADGKPDTYSIQDYCKGYFDDIDIVDSGRKYEKVIKAMLNYGAYSQLYFNYKTDDLANSILKASDRTVTDLTTYGKAFDKTTLPAGVLTGSNISLTDKIAVTINFKDADKVEFVDNDKTVTVSYGSTKFGPQMTISNILALHVTKNYNIKVTKGSETKTIKYGPSFYCHNIIDLNKAQDEQLKLLVQALCKFSNAVEEIS